MKQDFHELWRLFASVRSAEEAEILLTDLLTPAERRKIAKRWEELKLLAKGMPQRQIAGKLGVSISKITRGSRVLQEGSGGAWLFLERLERVKKRKR